MRGLLLIGLLYGTAGPASAADPLGITYIYSNAMYLDIDAAIDEGFFRDEGFAAENITNQSSVQSAQFMVSGAVQMAVVQIDPIISAITRGASDIAAIAAPADRPDWFLSALPEITSAKDLKGARIGFGALKVGEMWVVQEWLESRGVPPEEWTPLVVGSTVFKFAAMQNKSIAAAVLFQPIGTEAESMGFKTLFRFMDVARFPPVLYTVNRQWAGQNDRGKRVSRALVRAHQWLYDPQNRDAAIAILAKYTKRPPQALAAVYELFVGKEELLNRDAAVDIVGVNNEIARMAANGAVPPGTTLAPERYMLAKELGGLYR